MRKGERRVGRGPRGLKGGGRGGVVCCSVTNCCLLLWYTRGGGCCRFLAYGVLCDWSVLLSGGTYDHSFRLGRPNNGTTERSETRNSPIRGTVLKAERSDKRNRPTAWFDNRNGPKTRNVPNNWTVRKTERPEQGYGPKMERSVRTDKLAFPSACRERACSADRAESFRRSVAVVPRLPPPPCPV